MTDQYTPQSWNNDDPATPIDAARLTHIETGIDAVDAAVQAEVTARTTAISTEVSNRNTAISTAVSNEATNRDSAIEAAIEVEVGNRNSAITAAIDDIGITDLDDVDDEDKADGKVLTWISDTGQWEARTPSAPSSSLTANDFLLYRSVGTWSADPSYAVGDYVKGSDSAGYVCISPSHNNDPAFGSSPDTWAVVPQTSPVVLVSNDGLQADAPSTAQTPAAAGSIMLYSVGGAFTMYYKSDGRDYSWATASIAGTQLNVSNGLVVAENNDGSLATIGLSSAATQYLDGTGAWTVPVGTVVLAGDIVGDIGIQPGSSGTPFKIHFRGSTDDTSYMTWDGLNDSGLDGPLLKANFGGRLGVDNGSGGIIESLRWDIDGVHAYNILAEYTTIDQSLHVGSDVSIQGVNVGRFMGAWDNGTEYYLNDIVVVDGAVYRANTENLNSVPSEGAFTSVGSFNMEAGDSSASWGAKSAYRFFVGEDATIVGVRMTPGGGNTGSDWTLALADGSDPTTPLGSFTGDVTYDGATHDLTLNNPVNVVSGNWYYITDSTGRMASHDNFGSPTGIITSVEPNVYTGADFGTSAEATYFPNFALLAEVQQWDLVAATDLSSLTDASITSPANDQVLVYEDGAWINKAITASDVGADPAGSATTAQSAAATDATSKASAAQSAAISAAATDATSKANNALAAAIAAAAKPTPHPAVLGVVATLRRGVRSTCMQIVGDSTGTDPDEWWGIMSRNVAAAFPAYTVLWRQWNDATQDYDMPTNLLINTVNPSNVIQTGTGNGGGERRVTLTSGAVNYASAAITSDIDVRVRHTPAAGWIPGGAAATRTLVSHYNASGTNRSWMLWLDSTGNLNWTWSSSGSADTATVQSTVPVSLTNGTPAYLRVTHDVVNPATTGNDVAFYTSADGTTWTQLGSTVTSVGTTSFAAAAGTQTILGSHNGGGADFGNGDYYWVEVRNGIAGTNTVPPMPDDWDQITTSSSATVAYNGAPVLMLLCGSASGQAIAYFNDATRRPKMHIPHGQQVVFINTSHNEGNATHATWLTTFSGYITYVKGTALPNIPVVVMSQNPTGSTLGAIQYGIRATRGAVIMSYAAATAGVWGFDSWPAFNGADLSVVVETSDGIHPTQGNGSTAANGTAGSDLWGRYVFSIMFQGM